jgi:peptidyl-prolyl cis-trans isomerase C
MKLMPIVGAVALTLSLAACEKTPTGQVVAVVNGEEISLQELNAELQGQQIPENVDRQLVMNQLLQRVIDRKLLAQQAAEQGLDRDPEYLSQQRRMNETLLVQMMGQRAARAIRIPPAAEVDKFIASNPQMFNQRTRYALQQLQFDAPANMQTLQPLEDDRTLDEVAATLDQLGIRYQRGQSVLDSATAPPELMQRILALPEGEPFIVPAQGKLIANVIVGRQVTPTPAEQARPAATQALQRQSLQQTIERQLATARQGAEIEYQSGYSAEAAKGKAAPAAGATNRAATPGS